MATPDTAWTALSAYESVELVRRSTEERTGREPKDAKAREIAAYFAQGREYFRSAAAASELVRPLILYYGAVALARGVVLFLDPSKTKLVADHGLDAVGWKDLNTDPAAVAGLTIGLKRVGTFPELARVTGNVEWCMVGSERYPGEVAISSTGTDLLPDTRISIREALGQLPDVAGLYETTFGEHSRRLRCEVMVSDQPHGEGKRHAHLGVVASRTGLPSKDQVASAFGEGRVDVKKTGTNLLYFAREPVHRVAEAHLFDLYYDAGSADHPRLDMPVAALPSGEEYLKLPTDEGVVLSTLLALHVAAFAASTLVRYHPGYWAMLTGHTKGDAIGPVLSAAIRTVEQRYPGLVLEAIGG